MKKLLIVLLLLSASLGMTPAQENSFHVCTPENKEDLIICISKITIKNKQQNKDTTSLNMIDVSKVSDMSYLFEDENNFNADISQWNVSNVTNMKGMFAGAIRFDKNISNWDVSNVRDMTDMFDNTALEKSGRLPSWYR